MLTLRRASMILLAIVATAALVTPALCVDYVALGLSTSATRIFTETGTAVASIPVGLHDHLDFSPDGQTLFLSGSNNRVVSKVQTGQWGTQTNVFTLPSGGLSGIKAISSTQFYIGYYDLPSWTQHIGFWNGTALTLFADSGNIEDFDVAPDGTLWALGWYSGLKHFDTSGNLLSSVAINAARSFGWGPDANGDGVSDLYVGAHHNGVLIHDGKTGAYIRQYLPASGWMQSPCDIEFNASGTLAYITDSELHHFSTYDGTTLTELVYDIHQRGVALSNPYVPRAEPPSDIIEGYITDSVSGAPIPGAKISGAMLAGEPKTAVSGSDGHYALGADAGTYTLSVSAYAYSPASAQVTVESGKNTRQDFELTFDPQTRFVAVALGSGAAAVYDVPTRAQVGIIPAQQSIRVDISQDSRTLYVADFPLEVFTIPVGGSWQPKTTLFGEMYFRYAGIKVVSANKIYVGYWDGTTNRIGVWDGTMLTPFVEIPELMGAPIEDIEVAPDGTIWAVAWDNSLKHYDTSGNLLHEVPVDDARGIGWGPDVNGDGMSDLYVAVHYRGVVIHDGKTGEYIAPYLGQSGVLHSACDIEFNAEGTLAYMTDAEWHSIVVYDGVAISQFAVANYYPRGIAVSNPYVPRDEPPSQYIEGYITDSVSGAAIPGVKVSGAIMAGHSNSAVSGPDGHYAVAADAGTYTITASTFAYSPASAQVTVQNGENARQDFALTFNSQTSFLAVALQTSGPTAVYDAQTGTQIASIPAEQSMRVDISQDGRTLYVADSALEVFTNPVGGSWQPKTTLFGEMYFRYAGIKVVSANKIYVGYWDGTTHRIGVWNGTTLTPFVDAPVPMGAPPIEDIEVAPDGTIWALAWHSGLLHYDTSGNLLHEVPVDDARGFGWGPDANGDGMSDLYVAVHYRGVVIHDGQTGQYIAPYVGQSSLLQSACDIVFNASGNLAYISDVESGRVATYDGTTMSILINTGSYSTGPRGIALSNAYVPRVGVPYDKISSLKGLDNGMAIELTQGKVVTAIFTGSFYIEEPDRPGGIKVVGDGSALSLGDVVTLTGTMTTVTGERAILLGGIKSSTGGSRLKPLGMTNKTVSAEEGLLVKVWGNVSFKAPGGAYFYIDDGSGLADGSGKAGIRVDTQGLLSTVPSSGYVGVAGVVGKSDIGGGVIAPVIRVRDDADVTPF